MWDNENAKKAMKKMVDICKADNQKIAFTLSDLFCVDRHRDSFKELIIENVDILFANEDEIKQWLTKAGLPTSGKTILYDGVTSEPFEQEVTAGYIYMLVRYSNDDTFERSTSYEEIGQDPNSASS